MLSHIEPHSPLVSASMPKKLFLIPNHLGNDTTLQVIPAYVAEAISHIRHFAVEEEKSAQQLLKKLKLDFPFSECRFFLLNEHTSSKEIENIFKEVGGKDFAIISEAGCPCVADPGAKLVILAHKGGMNVVPLVGPSSIVLALMASGLNGQNFAFNGYLPKEQKERIQKIRELEKHAYAEGQTQIFMEAPYRNQNLFEDLCSTCRLETFLCLAIDLTDPRQYVKTLKIKDWRKEKPSLHKRPALFLINKSK